MPNPDRRGDCKDIDGSSPSPKPAENVPTENLVAEEHSPPPSPSSKGGRLPLRRCFHSDREEIYYTGTDISGDVQDVMLPAQLTTEEADAPLTNNTCVSSNPVVLSRGASCVSEDDLNISEFERVWETTNDIIDKPTAIASTETLSTSSRSFTSSRLLHSLSTSAPPPGGSSGVKRSYSFADSSALNSVPDRSVTNKYFPPHQRSPSYGSTPAEMCPLKATYGSVPVDVCSRNISWKVNARDVEFARGVELHVRLPQMEIEPRSPLQSLLQDCPPGAKALSSTEEMQDPDSDDYSVRRSKKRSNCSFSSGIGEPSVYHALVVIFLEFFAWGLLTSPMIIVLRTTFPDHTFLMNGIIMGIKGLLSFLSAPLIGALSDVWGRKFFLFITVFFTCLPIPFMKINTWWYFALISMSGVFAVTYSIVFAYVADVTDPAERYHAYGLVSASFAASLVTSPALGAYLSVVHSDDLVVGLATAIAVLDIFFILVAVPESLPEKLRHSSTSTWSTQISWEQVDPFSTLWKVSQDRNILLISVTVFLSYLPEAGQLSCFFVYLKLVMGFGPEMVATFIAVVGIMSVVAQTALLGLLTRTLSNKRVISVGLVFELLQLMWYGFGSQAWMMWAAGILAAISSITYPAISAYVSTHTDIDKQGVAQGIVTGMRGLCSGLGPAVFGFIFYLFHVDLNQGTEQNNSSLPGVGGGSNNSSLTQGHHVPQISSQVPGPPFVFGAMLVLLALTVSAFIPDGPSKNRKQSVNALDMGYNRDHKKSDSLDGTSQPLMNETGVL